MQKNLHKSKKSCNFARFLGYTSKMTQNDPKKNIVHELTKLNENLLSQQ